MAARLSSRGTKIEAHPHPAQLHVHNSDARFRVVAAGRRFGKSRLGVMECLEVAIHGGRSWWLAPTYKMTDVGWRPLIRMAGRIPGAKILLAEKRVEIGKGEISIRSADTPNTLRGEGLDFVVMDECAFIRPEIWPEAIRPALADRLGRALFISTPKGRNWFWDIYRRGEAQEEGWKSFTFPTTANPYIQPSEIEAAKRELPELIFRQEFLAEFIDDNGGVFRRVQEAAIAIALESPAPGGQYVAGVDVASAVDYTVVTVFDSVTKTEVFKDRFNRVDYNVLENRLESVYRRFNLQSMTIESNSIGQPVIDHLYKKGLNIVPFITTSTTKQAIIQGLQSAFEHGEIKIINEPVTIGELLSFESKRNQSGGFSYSAPDGMHDDTVMSMAIAWFAISSGGWLAM